MDLKTYHIGSERVIRDRNDAGRVVAAFYSETAFAIFVEGLARTKGASLYDADTGEYRVGSLDQLAGEV